jgi:hypothetical protein
MSTLNVGTIMKMIFDDKSYIIFAKHRTTVRRAKIEQNIQTVFGHTLPLCDDIQSQAPTRNNAAKHFLG